MRTKSLPPAEWPAPPSEGELAELSTPIDFPPPRVDVASPVALSNTIRLPRLPELHDFPSIPDFGAGFSRTIMTLPGIVGWQERSITGGDVKLKAFDQYVSASESLSS
jgi:hypothetical protein